jgi:hypothetical protein
MRRPESRRSRMTATQSAIHRSRSSNNIQGKTSHSIIQATNGAALDPAGYPSTRQPDHNVAPQLETPTRAAKHWIRS